MKHFATGTTADGYKTACGRKITEDKGTLNPWEVDCRTCGKTAAFRKALDASEIGTGEEDAVISEAVTLDNGATVYFATCDHGYSTGFYADETDAINVARGHGSVSIPVYQMPAPVAENTGNPELIDLYDRAIEIGYTRDGAADLAYGAFSAPSNPYGDECDKHPGIRRWADTNECDACQVIRKTNVNRTQTACNTLVDLVSADAFDGTAYAVARTNLDVLMSVTYPELTPEEAREAYLSGVIDSGLSVHRAVENFLYRRDSERHYRLSEWYSIEPGTEIVAGAVKFTVTGMCRDAQEVTTTDSLTGAVVKFPYAALLAHLESGNLALYYQEASDADLSALLSHIDTWGRVYVAETPSLGFRDRTIDRAMREGAIKLSGDTPAARVWIRV